MTDFEVNATGTRKVLTDQDLIIQSLRAQVETMREQIAELKRELGEDNV